MTTTPAGDHRQPLPRNPVRGKELPNYYIAPTRDFTQYTKDHEEQYWSRDTAFDWQQSVTEGLQRHVATLARPELLRVATLALPLVDSALSHAIMAIEEQGVPTDDDALRAIGDSLPSDQGAIAQALLIQAPLEQLELPASELRDRLVILERQRLELREQHRLRLFEGEGGLKRMETDAERKEQASQLAAVNEQVGRVRRALRDAEAKIAAARAPLTEEVGLELEALKPRLLAELAATRDFVRRVVRSGKLPEDEATLGRLQELVARRQLRALKDIANHALVVEQSAIAPLTMGIIHYKRRREIQEAMTTFVHDEAKHSAVFRRYLAEKMQAKERIPHSVIRGGDRYLWIARFMPSGAVFLAVVIEAIGGAYLEFFSKDERMPDPLFRSICRVIATRDEKRHMELCSATYNELYRKGGWWEQFRNTVALRSLLKSAYGDKHEDHQLIQACRAFGFESDTLYRFVADKLSQQLTTIGMYVPFEHFLAYLPKPSPGLAD